MVIHKERQMGLRGQFDQHQMETRRSAHPRKKTNSLSRKISKHQAKGKKSTRPKANGKRPGKPLPKGAAYYTGTKESDRELL